MLCTGLGTFLTYNPTTVSVETELSAAIQLMDQHCFRHLPVVGENWELVGVISDLDAARALLAKQAWSAHLPADGVDQVCRVGDVLMHEPCTVELDSSPRAALLTILEKGFHSLPVVQQEKLVGILTSSDFLRELSYGELSGYQDSVTDWMSEANMSISASASIDEAGEMMQQGSREHLVVTNGEQPLGIVSFRDVRRSNDPVSTSSARSRTGSVRKLLTREAATIQSDAKLGDAANQMLQQRTKALAVIDQSDQLRGLLTEDDLLRAVAAVWED